MNATTPIRITDIVATHPLYTFLSDASRARISLVDGLPADLVSAGDGTPTAIRYRGEAYTVRGVTWAQ